MLPRFYKEDVDNRTQQITTLNVFNDNVTEILENSQYEIPFKSGKNNLVINVTLGKDFPNDKPLLTITPIVDHPWVNETGVVLKAPGLLNYSPHSDLGRLVQAIIRELQRNPPNIIGDNHVISPNVPILDTEKRSSPSFSASYNFSPPQHINHISHVPHQSVFPQLNKLSLEELRFLNECEDRQAEFIDELPPVKEQNRMIEEFITQIEETAEENLKKEERLGHLKEVMDSQVEAASKLAFENERQYSIYMSLCDKYSPRNIQERLGKAAKEAEESSEKIAEKFLNGELEVEKFLNMFIKTKSLYQLRKTKEEKLCHQLDRLEKAGF